MLNPLGLVRQVTVFHGGSEPTRVVPATQMKHPGLFIDSVGNLREHRKIVGLQVVLIPRPPKKETAVAHVAFGVLSEMANSLGPPGQDFDGEGALRLPAEPDDGFSFLMLQASRPRERLANPVRELLDGRLRRGTDGNDYIDQREHQRSEVIGMHGHENHFSDALRQGSIEGRPFGWQHVMRLVQNDPMRPARPRPHRLQVRKQLSEEFGSIGERDAQQIDVQRDLGIFEKGMHLAYGYCVALVAKC